MKKYIIHMIGISGENYKFYTGQSTVNMVEQFMAEGRRFLWIKDERAVNLDEHAVNLNNIEHVQIHEIEEGERPR